MATIQVVPEKEFQSLSQWQLMKRRFFQHKLAVAAMVVLILFYATAIFCEFIAPYKTTTRNSRYLYAPPQRIRFIDNEGNFSLRPFVYGYKKERDPVTWQEVYTPDPDLKLPIYFSSRGNPTGSSACLTAISICSGSTAAPASRCFFSWAPMNWEGICSPASSTEPESPFPLA